MLIAFGGFALAIGAFYLFHFLCCVVVGTIIDRVGVDKIKAIANGPYRRQLGFLIKNDME